MVHKINIRILYIYRGKECVYIYLLDRLNLRSTSSSLAPSISRITQDFLRCSFLCLCLSLNFEDLCRPGTVSLPVEAIIDILLRTFVNVELIASPKTVTLKKKAQLNKNTSIWRELHSFNIEY